MKKQGQSCQGLMRALLIVIFVLAAQSVFAQDRDLTVHFERQGPMGFADTALCCHNYLQLFVSNPQELIGMSLGFEISYDVQMTFFADSSSRPGEWEYVLERGRALGAFAEPGAIGVDARIDGVSPDTLLITASTVAEDGLPPGSGLSCYELYFEIPYSENPCSDCIHIDNIFVPPSGTWTFNDGAAYAPTYNDQPNTSQEVPDAPAKSFPFIIVGALPPIWLTVPTKTAFQNQCESYVFPCAADEGGNVPSAGPVEYHTSAGSITLFGGELNVSAAGVCDTQAVELRAVNQFCEESTYDFDIVWTNREPQVTNCPTATGRIGLGDTYSYPFSGTDPDVCDDATFTATAFGTSPEGEYSMSQEGEFSFTPEQADDGQTFEFRVTVTDNCGGEDQCQMFLEVAAPLCGDCDGNGIVNVSDAVYLISYVFGAGMPPNPPSVADVDCNQIVNISDAVNLISYIFGGGSAPCEACP